MSAAPTRAQKLPSLDLALSGSLAGGILSADARVTDDGSPVSFSNDALSVTGAQVLVALAGDVAELGWRVNVSADQVVAGGVAARAIVLDLDGEGLSPSPETPIAIAIDGGADLSGAALPPFANGRLTLDGSASVPALDAIRVARLAATIGETSLAVSGTLDALAPRFALRLDGDAMSPGTGVGIVDGLLRGDVDISGQVTGDLSANTYGLDAFRLSAPALDVTVNGNVGPETVALTLAGNLADLASVTPSATGAIRFSASLDGPRAAPALTLGATGDSIQLAGTRLTGLALEASGTLDPAALALDASLKGQLGNAPLTANVSLTTEADGTRVLDELEVRVGDARLAGTLRLPPNGIPTGDLNLDVPDLSTVAPLALASARDSRGSLKADVRLAVSGDEATARITAEGRGIAIAGLRAARLDADLEVADYLGVPRPQGQVRVADAAAAGLTFSSIALDATRTGPGAFDLSLDVAGRDVSLNAAAGLTLTDGTTRIDLRQARGRAYAVPFALRRQASITIGEATRIDGLALDLGGGGLRVDGTVSPRLDVAVVLDAVPLSLANVAAPDLALSGTLSGTADITGTTADPDARFQVTASSVSAAPLRAQGLDPVDARASGRFAGQRLTLDASATSSFIDLRADGTIDLAGATPRVDLTVQGSASADPLADRLARAGARADLDIAIDLAIRGPLSDPDITGRITTRDATVGDAEGRFILRGLNADITLQGDRVVIESLSGRLGDGTLTVSGAIGLTNDLPADLDIRIDNGRFADGTLVVATVDAVLTLNGPLLGAPRLAGRVDLVRTLVTLDDFPVGGLDPVAVRHVNAPQAVLDQAARLGLDAAEGSGGQSRAGSAGGGLFLDVTVATQRPIAIRGRGLTVDLGGQLRLLGPVSAIQAVGAFELIRGDLELLDRRLEFTRGRLDFTGDLVPFIDFAATVQTDAAEITLRVVGTPSDLDIAVTSQPALPDDEALAQLLFGRSLSDLSPLQIVKLARGVAQLTGRAGPLEGALGALGNVDVDIDDEGNATVGIGGYVNDRTYVNVEQSTAGDSRVVIDLDVTDEVKARGSFSSSGGAGLGVFFEREY